MGTFFHPVTLIGPQGDRETVQALVDTGSSFTAMPAPVLERLGVNAIASVRLRLADGKVVERKIGAVAVELDGLPARPVICVFADPGSPPAIGAHTLESFLLGVDPDRQQLVPLEGWWA